MKLWIAPILIITISVAEGQHKRSLTSAEIDKLVPRKFVGYQQRAEPRSKEVRIGNLVYSLTERQFSRGKKSFKILLFDYADAPVMYEQAVRTAVNMGHVRNDSILFDDFQYLAHHGWQSHLRSSGLSRVMLTINDRFYLTVEGNQLPLEEVKGICQMIPFDKFPK